MVSKPTEEQKVILEAQFKKKHEKQEEEEETMEEIFQLHSKLQELMPSYCDRLKSFTMIIPIVHCQEYVVTVSHPFFS